MVSLSLLHDDVHTVMDSLCASTMTSKRGEQKQIDYLDNHRQRMQRQLQGDHSGCVKPPVETKTKAHPEWSACS